MIGTYQGKDRRVKVDSDLPTLAETQAILLYQSVRELLFNVLKHAKPDAADVSLKQKKDGVLEVTVRDYGKGCDLRVPDPYHRTFGLFNIQNALRPWTGGGVLNHGEWVQNPVLLSNGVSI